MKLNIKEMLIYYEKKQKRQNNGNFILALLVIKIALIIKSYANV